MPFFRLFPVGASAWAGAGLIVSVLLLAAAAPIGSTPAAAQGAAGPPASPLVVPGFWDPRRLPERPDISRLGAIRFMTEVDYPPFNFAGPDGNPAGFNVDLARMICEELKANCTMQMRRFDTLYDSLAQNRGDAAIASIAVTPEARRFHRPLLPADRALRRSPQQRDSRRHPGEGRGQEDRRGRGLIP
jgi:polar amino acid transport system substrate-binding protein